MLFVIFESELGWGSTETYSAVVEHSSKFSKNYLHSEVNTITWCYRKPIIHWYLAMQCLKSLMQQQMFWIIYPFCSWMLVHNFCNGFICLDLLVCLKRGMMVESLAALDWFRVEKSDKITIMCSILLFGRLKPGSYFTRMRSEFRWRNNQCTLFFQLWRKKIRFAFAFAWSMNRAFVLALSEEIIKWSFLSWPSA